MRLPTFALFLCCGLLTGCGALRPAEGTVVRNPSRLPDERARTTRTSRPPVDPSARHPRTRSNPRPNSRTDATTALRGKLVSHAEGLIGLRYKYGGNNPREGFDCSGFVKYLYDNEGFSIHRVSRDQAQQGRPVPLQAARPGDIVYFQRGRGQPVFHVSMVVAVAPGQVWVIHPTSSRGVVREDIMASSFWRPKIAGVRSLLAAP